MERQQHNQPLPKLSIHSGNGKLRGGGVRRPISSNLFLQLSQKLEQRLGPVLLICLATIGTVLTINGLFHEKARASLVQMMDTLEQELLQIQRFEVAQLSAATASVEGTSTDNNATLVDNAPARAPLLRLVERLDELDAFRQAFREIDLTLWTLVVLSLLGLVLTGLGLFVLRARGKRTSRRCTIAFRAVLLLIGLLLLVQMFLLLFSLLPNCFRLPSIVDQLFSSRFLDELPPERQHQILEPIEDDFACKLKVEHELLERLGLQEKCLPKIKDRLLAPYAVLFLAFVAFVPFLFALFTFLWTARLKDWEPVREARLRVELGQGERRPQSREQILARTMGTNGRPKERMTEKIYY